MNTVKKKKGPTPLEQKTQQVITLTERLERCIEELAIRGKDLEHIVRTVRTHGGRMDAAVNNMLVEVLNPYIKRNTSDARRHIVGGQLLPARKDDI